MLDKCVRAVLLSITCALLSSCYLVPGTFAASLDIRRDGTFTYRYEGDIAYAYSGEKPEPEWQDSTARCWDGQTFGQRACSKDEIDKQRRSYVDRRKIVISQSAELATLIGFNPRDDDANRQIAADLMQSQGWRRVIYKGNGVFAVEYETRGTLDRDFVFPISPEAVVVVPFLSIFRSKAGVVNVSAPGFTGGAMRKILLGNRGVISDPNLDFFGRINGTFELTSDAEISDYTGKPDRSGNSKNQTKVRWQIFRGEVNHSPRSIVEAQLILPVQETPD